jgi:type I restriction enzyme R subunit
VDARPPSDQAEAIVGILREEWGRGNEFAHLIAYRTTGDTPESLIKASRTSYYPRIAVTAGMITAAGTYSLDPSCHSA